MLNLQDYTIKIEKGLFLKLILNLKSTKFSTSLLNIELLKRTTIHKSFL